jgi:hypothetical protein
LRHCIAPGNEIRDGRREGRRDESRIRERGEKVCERGGARERGSKGEREEERERGEDHVAESDG